MKLKFNLANWAQQQAVGSVSAIEFLQLEQSSKAAMGVAISESIETLGPESPVWTHIASLVRDYGRLPQQDSEQFELLLKAYLSACLKGQKEAAKQLWKELDSRFTDHTADKAFRRLVENNAQEFCGVEYSDLEQEHIDRFCSAVKTAETLEWDQVDENATRT